MLAFLSYPTNIILGGIAAFILALPLVTLLPSAIALTRAFARWRENGDDAVFTNTFREFGATWKRSLGIGAVSFGLLTILATDIAFLAAQLSNKNGSQIAILFSAAVIPVGVLVTLLLLAIPVAAGQQSDATAREWIRAAFALFLTKPFQSLKVLVVLATVLISCVALPTLIPFISISIPTYLAAILWSAPVGGSQQR